jgi:hypothetical protein
MVKCNRDQVKRLQKALRREKDPSVRQRIQMVLLREDGMFISLSRMSLAQMTYSG